LVTVALTLTVPLVLLVVSSLKMAFPEESVDRDDGVRVAVPVFVFATIVAPSIACP
jgi:hypothetical protein